MENKVFLWMSRDAYTGVMIARTLFLDLETDRRAAHLYKAGLCIESLNGGTAWSWADPASPQLLRGRLDDALFEAVAISGHNIWRHDLPVLARRFPEMALLKKLPVLDTLELSPLCFPKNPYHALEKDYKPIGREENDPLGDALLAKKLLRQEKEALQGLRDNNPVLHQALHGLCASGDGRMERGYAQVFGCEIPTLTDTRSALRACAGQNGCITTAAKLEVPDTREERMALAYVLAWLSVAGDYQSVLPGWVMHQFPKTREVAAALRDTPCGHSACRWCAEQFDSSTVLQKWFPEFSDFRREADGSSLQQEIVESSLAGQSLMAILPTGGGKSLCYQLPALSRMERRGRLTIVISPLQSLMKDQVDQLARRIPTAAGCAAALNGLLTPLERRDVLHRIAMGDISLLFVAPEQLRNRSFCKAIQQREIGAWVFDEAHCVSKWGHDFRTDYLYAERFIRERMGAPIPPIMYVTATAKTEVIAEIRSFHESMTGSRDLQLFESSVERPGLRFEVMKVSGGLERMRALTDILSDRLSTYGKGGAIVFRSTRAKARETSDYLKQHGWNAAHFHAGLPPEEKKEVQHRFIAGDLQVIAATNAFGMGVDKADIRVVIHGDMPGSIENYIQEAGRAGRDRAPADCVLLYDENDAGWQFSLNGMNRLSRREIAEILRVLRRHKRREDQPIVVTVGELMRDTRLREIWDPQDQDRGLNTKVKTAISWLERAEYVKRDDNVTRVFQAKPLVQTRKEAEMKAAELGCPPEQQKFWGDILNEFVYAKADEGIDFDRFIALPSFEMWHKAKPFRSKPSSLLFEELRAMTRGGLLRECTSMTAYVRYKVSDPAHLKMDRLSRAEDRMLNLLAEQGVETETKLVLDTALLNQRLKDEGGHHIDLQELERMATSLGGLELNGSRLLEIRPGNATRHQVTLRAEMGSVQEAASMRREVARLALDVMLAQIPPTTPASKDVLTEFTMQQLCEAVDSSLLLQATKLNTTVAVEQALLWLHDVQIIRLQKGLALFRSAMTIRVVAEPGQTYGAKDYEPLGQFYDEKTFQIHVMLEYATRGLKSVEAALTLVLDYFRLEKKDFTERYFPGRKGELARAATAEAYRQIAEDLGDAEQRRVVEAPEEQNVLVLAGPGSGKTKTVVHRIAWLLKIKHVPAHAILALCFNHDAAVQLRQRLRELAGDVARGVTVMTYHGLAMRLTGTSFSALAGRTGHSKTPEAGEADFERPIREAIQLLKGKETAEHDDDSNEIRERLLAGFQHILVDEYQDVDGIQYELISALAGRQLQDQESKLGLLAVGDDDQSIYAFRGADVRFIRRFEQDYESDRYALTSNYRSTATIVNASAGIIEGNRNRMKTELPLHVNPKRQADSAGAPVRLLAADSLLAQTAAAVRHVKEWQAADTKWQDMAVLGVSHEDLDAFRSAAETEGIPVNIRLSPTDRNQGGGLPALWRIRECKMLLDLLHSQAGEELSREQIEAEVNAIREKCGPSVWSDLLQGILLDVPEERAFAEDWIEHIHESLAGFRREGRVAQNGIWLSTVHASKGTEHLAVLVVGSWNRHWEQDREEARRLLYVGMTRARTHLAIVDRQENPCGLLAPLRAQTDVVQVPPMPAELPMALKQYHLLGPADVHLSYAGQGATDWLEKVASTLRIVRAGQHLNWAESPRGIVLKTNQGVVALLSKSSSQQFYEWEPSIEKIRVLGVYVWRKEDNEPEYQDRCGVDQWGVPLCEVVLRSPP